MKTDARTLKQGTRGKPQLLEPPGADPHAGWCGRGERETAPPIPIYSQSTLVTICDEIVHSQPILCRMRGLLCGVLREHVGFKIDGRARHQAVQVRRFVG